MLFMYVLRKAANFLKVFSVARPIRGVIICLFPIYLFQVKKSNFIGLFRGAQTLTKKCSEFHLNWRRVVSFTNFYQKVNLIFNCRQNPDYSTPLGIRYLTVLRICHPLPPLPGVTLISFYFGRRTFMNVFVVHSVT